MCERMIQYLRSITDPRNPVQTRYPLYIILFIVFVGSLAGNTTWKDIHEFAQMNKSFFQQFFPYLQKIPNVDTIRRAISRLDYEEFSDIFVFIFKKQIDEIKELEGKIQLSIDGKCLKGSTRRGCKITIINAILNGLVVGEKRIEDKTNEITMAPVLLAEVNEKIPLADVVVSSDAMSCQKRTAKCIRSKKAHCLINAKENQPSLNEGIESYFTQASILYPNDVNLAYYCSPYDKAHGRIEYREIWVASFDNEIARQWLPVADWSGLRSAAKVTRHFQYVNSVNKPEEMHRNYISSLICDPKEMLDVIIKHWEVETLHNLLDGDAFQEDKCRIHNQNAASILSTFRKVCINMLWPILKMHPGTSMPSLTRLIDRSKQYRMEVLTKNANEIASPNDWRNAAGDACFIF